MGIIAGVFYPQQRVRIDSLRKVRGMLQAQKHRDPVEPVMYAGDSVILGMANSHNAIYSKVAQPTGLQDSNEFENGCVALLDGVILEGNKHKLFFDDSGHKIPRFLCTELMLAAYKVWGMDCMLHMEGEFSCVLWDGTQKRLILIRDPYGHKPLHYLYDGKKIVFASEIKGVLAYENANEIDLVSLSDYLTLNCIPCPATIFKKIRQVPPGQMVIISRDGEDIKKFWSPRIAEDVSRTLEESAELFAEQLKQAVKKRMLGDSTYCFLSGGVDSSAICSFASELSNKPVHAVTIGFDEKEKDEFEDAKAMVAHIGAKHHHVVAKADSFFDILERLVFHHDSPFTDTSAYPSYFAGQLARELTDVVLTGDGPDQLLGGSSHHVFAVKKDIFSRRSVLARTISRLESSILCGFVHDLRPSLVVKAMRNSYRHSLTSIAAAYDLRSYFPDIVKRRMCEPFLWNIHKVFNPFRHPESWFAEAGAVSDINKYLFADLKFYVPDDLMIKVDRMCMAHGLETLSPFQDVGLARVAHGLKSQYKIMVGQDGSVTTKYILRHICRSRFPQRLLTKNKQGFGVPLEKWLLLASGKRLKEILLDPRCLNRGYFRKSMIVRMVDDFISRQGDYYYPSANGLVGLITLELWHRLYVDRSLF